MNKIVIIAIIINILYLMYNFVIEIGDLRKDIEGIKCKKLEKEKCSSWIWNKLFFEKKDCIREKCPGFVGTYRGSNIRGLSLWSVLAIFFGNYPAIATLILLFLEL